jgi:hypothetical protein
MQYLGGHSDTVGVRFTDIVTLSGWWRPDNTSATFIRCIRASHCVGGTAEEDGCAANRYGPLWYSFHSFYVRLSALIS